MFWTQNCNYSPDTGYDKKFGTFSRIVSRNQSAFKIISFVFKMLRSGGDYASDTITESSPDFNIN